MPRGLDDQASRWRPDTRGVLGGKMRGARTVTLSPLIAEVGREVSVAVMTVPLRITGIKANVESLGLGG